MKKKICVITSSRADYGLLKPFLDKKYDNYNSKDFFSTNITWHDEYNKGTYNQRLDGVFFYK